jgi:hypothetical protein
MTSPSELPPLPPSYYVLGCESDGYTPDRLLNEDAYTAEQMRTYALQAQALAPLDAPAAREADERSLDALRVADVLTAMVDCAALGADGLWRMTATSFSILHDAAHHLRQFARAAPTGVPQDIEPTRSDE